MKPVKNNVKAVGILCLLALPISGQAQNWATDLTGTYQVRNTTPAVVPFAIQNGGDGLANANQMFLSSNGNVGLGTTTPGGAFSARLHIADETPDILLEDTEENQRWYLFADFEGMGFGDETSSTIPFFVETAAPFDSLYVNADGFVGMGTPDPIEELHVVGSELTQLLVENTDAGATGDQTMFVLKNASTSKVRFAIASDGDNAWTFDNNPAANAFSISKVGTGVNEFLVSSIGDGTFRGRSFATQHINTSTRAAKTDFAELDVDEVLARLAVLPVTQWRYKSETESSKHIGPVAEDFQQAFGLGDGKTISTVDASGIALASIQALYGRVLAKDEQLQEQRTQLDNQEQLIEKQSERLLQLEMAFSSLQRQVAGDQLAHVSE